MYGAERRAARRALRGGAARPASASTASSWSCASARRSRATRCARRSSPSTWASSSRSTISSGVLFRFMEERGLLDNTLIVFTSDHGDYLGDHWMGEKDLFHEPSVKIPLIVYDPSASGGRGARHGLRRAGRSRSISCRPSCESLGADPGEQSHRLEGRSLVPFLDGSSAGRMAPVRHQRVRLFAATIRGQARHRAARCAAFHGGGQALEVHPRAGLPADALRPRDRPQRVPRPRRRSRTSRPSGSA